MVTQETEYSQIEIVRLEPVEVEQWWRSNVESQTERERETNGLNTKCRERERERERVRRFLLLGLEIGLEYNKRG